MALDLDFLTEIVNVHWEGGPQQIVIGMPNNSFGATPETMTTKDGQDFNTNNFGVNTFSGASGLGKTVIGRGYKLLAFGEPRDGPPCFIAVDGNWSSGTDQNIQRGVLNDAGELEWKSIGTVPSGGRSPFSCTFAGDGFFIVYSTDNSLVNMGVSFDGKKFKFGIDPFVGVDSKSVCDPDRGGSGSGFPDAIGGSVAYDQTNDRYVTTGSFERTYKCHYIVHSFVDDTLETTAFDRNFMSSISTDGLSWTPKFDQSEGYGTDNYPTNPAKDIGHDSAGTSTVCFSDALGLFVASSTYKNNNLNLNNAPPATNSQEFPVFYPASSVATSKDGVNWTNKLLGPESTLIYGEGATFAFSYCVIFVKTDAIDDDKGFFLLGASGGSDYESAIKQHGNLMWRSEDAVKWTQTRASDRAFPQAMTAIDKDANKDNVVYVGD